ncbi:molybdopterin binding aldehyde oxidase/xanthine dehydrogenase [Lobosporangium transversale]|uniref:Molybdopterin binding aldehyde oxidase/xanthine dehydrogenase n=1 Tax=Lobosporangium transversale TaxID=64571 RepID=A0A1Y2GVC2_9FUNG|nr:molybdopterin binding aldehyde oxidase/xanthine dehydrogenase [Lobosporangium transversale]ORZ24999.1 molybdopterin binding aldehyde oxidase/xanthine dehydrogenase [Lobosporangium transversale]|eukprot:XP_021883980.1 molybdopterin binding aldehyde oxidase/xanthine dehydrogenase [Lobosporangium transversale]
MVNSVDFSSFSSTLRFYLNGTEVILENPDPDITLLQYVRSIGLTGTKFGCAEGGCGACTVMVSSYDRVTKHIKHLNVNACLTPLCSVDGKHVITIEGLGNHKDPHPVQERIALCFGSQCGFCTPGIAMSLYTFLRNNERPSEYEIEDSFDGNLCRCTGYRPILDAAKSFAVPQKAKIVNGFKDGFTNRNSNSAVPDGCCGKGGANGVDGCCKRFDVSSTVPQESSFQFPSVLFKTYDPTQELIFPPQLMKVGIKPLHFRGRKTQWFRPTTLSQARAIKAAFPHAKYVGGNTEVGIQKKFKHAAYSPLIYLHDITELQGIRFTSEEMIIGANVTIANFQKALEDGQKKVAEHQVPVLHAFLANIKHFAGRQIRNAASVAGNIATASPVSALNPIFIASNSTFSILSSNQSADASTAARVVPATEFFQGCSKTALNPETDILTEIHIPLTRPDEYIRAFKQTKRRDDDTAIVSAAIRVRLSPEDHKVIESSFVYGNMTSFTCQAVKTSARLKDKRWGDESVLSMVLESLDEELPMQVSAPGGMPEYRRALAKSLFFRFWWDVVEKRGLSVQHDHGNLKLLTSEIHRHVSRGTQDAKAAVRNAETEVVAKGIAAISAMKQATGEARYTDDIPSSKDELYAALVLSTRAHAKVISVDASKALAYPGVKDYIDHTRVPGSNDWHAALASDETIFVTDTVLCVGQIIGLVIADSQAIAQEAAQKVKVEYSDLPAIVTIDEAIAADSYLSAEPRTIIKGDVDAAFKTCAKVFEGETRVGAQEHFYLETHSAIASYSEGEVEIIAATQYADGAQAAVADTLGLSSNKVVCKVKRVGGAFGGKESRGVPLICAISVASYCLKKPIRIVLDRNEDMIMTGQRHPFKGKWKVGLDQDNKLVALDIQLYLNAGYSLDYSPAVMDRALTHSEGVYYFSNIRTVGRCCRTNLPSNTSFRGFGGPQITLIAESFMNEVAEQLNIPVEELREKNFYKEGQKTHYNQVLEDWHIPEGYYQLKEKARYDERRLAIQEFNKLSKWRKRGISLIPTKHGIGIDPHFMNQAGALIHIYLDGSVLVTHGGVEMGQGLHTKMIQVCAEVLKVPMDLIHTMDMSTDKIPNAIPTIASISSDTNGMAVKDAAEKLYERLQSYRNPKGKNLSWREAVIQAYQDGVHLSATGFYKHPQLGHDWEKNEGHIFHYYTTGVAISEVEVDMLTGTYTILRSDISMDLGRSLNPSIDIGQIEGGFIQGVGYVTTEESLFSPDGMLLTQGPGSYKIPGFKCIPQEMNISFFEDVTHESIKTIFKSKGIGEPPLLLGSSVYFAIRDAVRYARQDHGHTEGTFSLPIPATPEKVRMAVGDVIAESSRLVAKPGEKPSAVLSN